MIIRLLNNLRILAMSGVKDYTGEVMEVPLMYWINKLGKMMMENYLSIVRVKKVFLLNVFNTKLKILS